MMHLTSDGEGAAAMAAAISRAAAADSLGGPSSSSSTGSISSSWDSSGIGVDSRGDGGSSSGSQAAVDIGGVKLGDAPPAAVALGRLRGSIGARVVDYVVSDAGAVEAAALETRSASLDNIRGGVRALLRYFQGRGEGLGVGVLIAAGAESDQACFKRIENLGLHLSRLVLTQSKVPLRGSCSTQQRAGKQASSVADN